MEVKGFPERIQRAAYDVTPHAISPSHNRLGEFVGGFSRMATRRLASQWKKRIDQLADELRRVKFAAPEGFDADAMQFWPMGMADGLVRPAKPV